MSETGADALGLDWTTDLGLARQHVGGRVALQGNMDPSMLFAPPARIREEVARILACYGHCGGAEGLASGHVFNLGHGIDQHVNPAHAGAFIEAVVELSAAYHTPV